MKKFSQNYEHCLVSQELTLMQALEVLSKSGLLIVCVVDQHRKLLGVLTDSNVRSALLAGASLKDPLTRWMTTKPVVALSNYLIDDLTELANTVGVRELPLVDGQGVVTDIFVLGKTMQRLDPVEFQFPKSSQALPNSLMILAGGKGTRLRSVVSDRPKPLAVVGGKPILETVIRNAIAVGFRKIFISVNYLAHQIEDFIEKAQFDGASIEIIRETKELGTAGSLAFLKDKVSDPFVVTNADVLTTLPLDRLLAQHLNKNSMMTCAVRHHIDRVPFGVFEILNNKIVGIQEKPVIKHLVNCGIYVLDPAVLQYVKDNEPLDMPALLGRVLDQNGVVTPFYSHEYWLDIGRPDDYHRANQDFETIFGSP